MDLFWGSRSWQAPQGLSDDRPLWSLPLPNRSQLHDLQAAHRAAFLEGWGLHANALVEMRRLTDQGFMRKNNPSRLRSGCCARSRLGGFKPAIAPVPIVVRVAASPRSSLVQRAILPLLNR